MQAGRNTGIACWRLHSSSGVRPPAHLPLPDRLTQLEPAHVCKQDEPTRRPVCSSICLKHPAPDEATVPHEVRDSQAAACQHARHVGQRAQLHSRTEDVRQNRPPGSTHDSGRGTHRQCRNKTSSAQPHQQQRLQTGLPLSQLMANADAGDSVAAWLQGERKKRECSCWV